ncbi:MAG TPA: hypothetical protein VFM18_11060, partial [Methanosarcina sp.]|nr:hypothetical protein [Methanosarcina sp.]
MAGRKLDQISDDILSRVNVRFTQDNEVVDRIERCVINLADRLQESSYSGLLGDLGRCSDDVMENVIFNEGKEDFFERVLSKDLFAKLTEVSAL